MAEFAKKHDALVLAGGFSDAGNTLSEDEIKGLEEKCQKMTDRFIADIDKAVEAKTKEIMTV